MATVQSVHRAFTLLKQLASEEMSLTELADASNLPKSTVARLLKTLEHEGAVGYEVESNSYRIGPSITSLAGTADRSPDLIARARPHLVVLAEATGEDAGFAVRDGADAHYIAQSSTSNPVQVRDWTGERLPLHTVASGLAMLAFETPAFRDRYLGRDLERFTATTMTDPDLLRERFRRVRAEGHVWCHGEYVPDLTAVAAPVLDATGRPVAAIHVHGPSYRFPPDGEADTIASLVRDKAHVMSEQVGAIPA